MNDHRRPIIASKLVWRMIITLIAYLVASLAAGLVLHTSLLWTTECEGIVASCFAQDGFSLELAILTSLVAANIMFIPTTVPIVFAEFYQWRRFYFYLGVTALLVACLPLVQGLVPFMTVQGEWTGAVIWWGWGLAILSSASVYWLLAGRKAGDMYKEPNV
jgi:hypothetical protein